MISADFFLREHHVADGLASDDGQEDDSHYVNRHRHASSRDVDPQDVDACREAALRLLDAAPRSSGGLRARLADKGYDAPTVDAVIERLIELRLLDDRAYAESAVRYCLGRLMGERGALMELQRKGVERRLAAQIVDEACRQGLFEESAWELGRKILRKTRNLDRRVRLRRFWAAGGRKGHDPETLRRIAHELFDDAPM